VCLHILSLQPKPAFIRPTTHPPIQQRCRTRPSSSTWRQVALSRPIISDAHVTTRRRSDFIGQPPDTKLRPACTCGGTKLSERRVRGVFIGDPTALARCQRTYVDHPRYHPQIRTLFAEKRCRPTELPRQLGATSVVLIAGLPQTAVSLKEKFGVLLYDSCTSSHVCLCSNVA